MSAFPDIRGLSLSLKGDIYLFDFNGDNLWADGVLLNSDRAMKCCALHKSRNNNKYDDNQWIKIMRGNLA
ncbi:hypothetical protein [Kosakonia sp. CFBP8986]|uniref:hypothetical protein n=1 Tax=Kosakonia sp. CFBP8986 TaxID=3096524 RepID=UPI002A6AFD31|nr:hypothetical protein [Kosakonia sp. CFBP8986]MDY0886685.1 hypothetical protein [Kosakonia sp. CFBP8986]